MFGAGEAGETGVRAQQLSVCTLQAGSVCSVDTGGVRRVSALSSVHLHGYVCVGVCGRVCVSATGRERAGGWGKVTNRLVWTGGGFSLWRYQMYLPFSLCVWLVLSVY